MPAGEAVDLDREELDLAPVGEFVYAVGKEGDEADEGGTEGGQAGGLDLRGEGVLGDEEAALEVVSAVDEDEEAAVVDVAKGVAGVALSSAETEPEDVDGDSGLVDGEVGGGAGGGVAAVAAYDERGVDVDWSGRSVDVDSDDAVICRFR